MKKLDEKKREEISQMNDLGGLEGLLERRGIENAPLSEKTIYNLGSNLSDFKDKASSISKISPNEARFIMCLEVLNYEYALPFGGMKVFNRHDRLKRKFLETNVSIDGHRSEQYVRILTQGNEAIMRAGTSLRERIFGR